MEKSINIAMLGNSKMEILLKNRKKKKDGVSCFGKGDKQNIFQELTSEFNLEQRGKNCIACRYLYFINYGRNSKSRFWEYFKQY